MAAPQPMHLAMGSPLHRVAWVHVPLLLLLLAPLLLSDFGAQAAGVADGAATSGAEARVIVKYRSDSPLLRRAPSFQAAEADAGSAMALSQRTGLVLRAGRNVGQRGQVVMGDGVSSAELAERLAREDDVEYAVVDERRHISTAPNDPYYLVGPPINGSQGGPATGQWYLRAPDATVRSSLNVESAWAISEGRTVVVVAVLDTGVRFDHVDLRRVADGGNLLDGYDFVSNVFQANDGDGRDPDASDPGDWVTLADVNSPSNTVGCTSSDVGDSSWHGTQVAGLIGAITNNGVGMASVGRRVHVLPVRVLGKCGGFDSDIAAAMLWAVGLSVPGVPVNPTPANVLNLSLGGPTACNAVYQDAVNQVTARGAVVVAAAGNSTGHAVSAPANCSGVIAVAGLRHAGTKVGFSDLGPEIAISAPGGNCVNVGAGQPCLYPILSTTNSGTTTPVPDASGGSIYSDSFQPSLGTSFSAPLVSGTLALMLSVQPSLTPAQLRSLVQASGRPFPTTGATNSDGTVVPTCTTPNPLDQPQVDQLQCYCTTSTCGSGMLDAGAAVAAAAAPTITVPMSGSVVYVGTPTLLWPVVPGATWYRVWLSQGSSGPNVLPCAPTGAVDPNGCWLQGGLSLPVTTPLSAGAYTLSVLAWSPSASAWSTATHFTVVSRFVLGLKGKTVIDNQTGLEWEIKTNNGDGSIHDVNNTYTWSTGTNNPDGTAFTVFLAGLNAGACVSTSADGMTDSTATDCSFAGHGDWRLPTATEVSTISSCTVDSNCIDPVFGTSLVDTMTSSTINANPTLTWVFCSNNASCDAPADAAKVAPLGARAVRSTR